MSGFLTARAEQPRIVPYDWGRMEWLVDDLSHNNPGFSLARMIVQAGRCSELHKHMTCHEAISVTSGKCTVIFDHQRIALNAGKSVFITKGTPHAIDNADHESDVVLLTTYALGTQDYHPL